MIENNNEISEFSWTARKFEINQSNITFANLMNIVLNFVSPSVQEIRHGKNNLAQRWYWSWLPNSATSVIQYCRLYFLAKTNHHEEIWDKVESIRSERCLNLIELGAEEPAIEPLSNENLERGIALEYMSEINLMVWRGTSVNTEQRYREMFHFLSQPLIRRDEDLFRTLRDVLINRVQ